MRLLSELTKSDEQKRQVDSGIMRLEVTTEGVSTGTSSESWREWVADFSGCNAKLWAPTLVF